MAALPIDALRLGRGVPTATLLLLIIFGVYAFIACAPSTGSNASPDVKRQPLSDPEVSEAVDRHLPPENGEHQDGNDEFGEQPLQNTSSGEAQPLSVGLIPPNSSVIKPQKSATKTLQLPFAPDGIRYGLLSPQCHGSPDPDCGPTQMYVGETLALAIHAGNTGYGLHFTQNKDDESGPALICGRPAGQMDDALQKYQQVTRERGNAFEFQVLNSCASGRVTVLLDRSDGKTGQHHIEIIKLPDSVEQHPNVPTPLPTIPPAQVEKAKLLQERFNKVTAKLNDQTFQLSLQGVALTCPAYANSKTFEINEKLTEKHQNAGLLHLMDARRRGTSSTEVWAMIEDDPEQAEAYVKILEWGYDEFSDMIKKPGSMFGCN